MAKALRIDDATVDQETGAVSFSTTHGQSPLPQTEQGAGFSWASREAFVADVLAWEESLSAEQLLFLAASPGLKADPDMSNMNVFKNRRAQLDLFGAGSAVKLT